MTRPQFRFTRKQAGLGPGEEVVSTGRPMSVELGPGLISTIYDGIQRPLEKLYEASGANIHRGVEVPALDREKKWYFKPVVKKGDKVQGGDIIGVVQETAVVECRIMIPPKLNERLKKLKKASLLLKRKSVL